MLISLNPDDGVERQCSNRDHVDRLLLVLKESDTSMVTLRAHNSTLHVLESSNDSASLEVVRICHSLILRRSVRLRMEAHYVVQAGAP
jgi:hypothetical protein